MKPLIVLSLVLFVFIQASHAQKDTIISYLDDKLNHVPDTQAVAVSIAIRRDSVWEVLLFDAYTEKKISTAYSKDPECKVLHGLFESFQDDGKKLSVKGWFSEGKRIGVWRTWDEVGDLVDSAVYHDGKMARKYTIRATGPQLIKTAEDYEADTSREMIIIKESGLLYNETRRQQDTRERWSYHSNGKLFKYAKRVGDKMTEEMCYFASGELAKDCRKAERKEYESRTPEFPGGAGNFQLYIVNNIYIPPDYNTAIRSGYTTMVSFMLDEKGKAYDIKILESSHPDLDKPLRDVIRTMPHWNMKTHKGAYGPIIIPFRVNLSVMDKNRNRSFNSRSTGFEDY